MIIFPLLQKQGGRGALFEGQLYPVYSVVQRKPRSAIQINIGGAERTEQCSVFLSKQMTNVVGGGGWPSSLPSPDLKLREQACL